MIDESFNIKFKVKYFFNFCGLEKVGELQGKIQRFFYKVNSQQFFIFICNVIMYISRSKYKYIFKIYLFFSNKVRMCGFILEGWVG